MLIEKARNRFIETQTSILLFFDPDREYEKEIREEHVEDFEILVVDRNYFHIKYEIEINGKGRKFLLYHPFEKPERRALKNYPLTNLLLAGQELLLDEAIEVLDEFKIHHRYAPLLVRFKHFVIAKKYENDLLPILAQNPFDPDLFTRAILSFVLEEKYIGNGIFNLIRVFEQMEEGEEVWEKTRKRLEKYKLIPEFLENVKTTTDIPIEDASFESLSSLFNKLKYNGMTSGIKETKPEDPYLKLRVTDHLSKIKISTFFKEWNNSRIKSQTLDPILDHLGSQIQEEKLFEIYGLEADYGLRTKKADQYVIKQAMEKAVEDPQFVIEKMGALKNNERAYAAFRLQIDFLLNTSKYFRLRSHFKDFIFNRILDYYEKYTEEIFQLDLFYRRAFTAYQLLNKESSIKAFEHLFGVLNKSYDQYLIDLNLAWTKLLAEKDFNLNQVSVPKQHHFFKDFIQPNENKKVVIISDAFRYELAADLEERLQSDSQNKMEIDYMTASIPSYTNLGMSNLLPNEKIEAVESEGSVNYSIDGIVTGSANRGKILEKVVPASAVISYSSFVRKSLSEQRAFLKGQDLIYIYHNWMDTIGDDQSSEYYTFESVKQCVDQLEKLIARLYKSLNTSYIYVTADHGFLFNYNKITEPSRQPFPKVREVLKEHTRFCLTKDQRHPAETFSFPLSMTTNIDSDIQVILPKVINRFRKKGRFGVQFVHGGASLQEIVVPVFKLYRQRRETAEEVSFVRLDNIISISTSSTRFKVLQKNSVDENHKSLEIVIGLYAINGILISNEVELLLDSTKEDPSERVYEFRLDLTVEGSHVKVGYLKAFRKEDKDRLNPIVINDMIQINTQEIDEF